MKKILIAKAFFKSLHLVFVFLLIMVLYSKIILDKTKNKRLRIYKLVSAIISIFVIYVITTWYYYLDSLLFIDILGMLPKLSLRRYIFSVFGLIIIGLYPNIFERFPKKYKVAYTSILCINLDVNYLEVKEKNDEESFNSFDGFCHLMWMFKI